MLLRTCLILIQAALAVIVQSLSQVGPDCEQLLHNVNTSHGGRGTVSSPAYPEPYPDRKLCIQHVLEAPVHHLVHLTVADVDTAPLPAGSGGVGCLAVYSRWPDSSDVSICHDGSPGRRSWFSTARRLMLQFTSEGNPARRRGFSAVYRFVDRSRLVTRGQHLPGDDCRLLLLSEDRSSGHIFSEGFPSSSPGRSCSYTLYGSRGQRVAITVQQLTLQPADSTCLHGDRVTVHDGTTPRSQVIADLCHRGQRAVLVSSGPFLHVVSHVTRRTAPSRTVLGFHLLYRFEADPAKQGLPEELVPSKFNKYLDMNSLFGPSDGVHLDRTSVYAPSEVHCETSCNRMILSDYSKSGVIHSPGFPQPYPSSMLCRFEFQGKGNERIIIRFDHFNLKRNSSAKSCLHSDSVTAFSVSAGRPRLLRRVCGAGRPTSLMSTDSTLLLLFATGAATGQATGFSATYKFVENYGIETGLQLETRACAFEFVSSMTQEGYFGTPNAPGHYPGNTDCHFWFRVDVNETVLIHFNYFDVEGIYPCTLGSASDYLEVSRDRGPPERFCGDTAPDSPLISDGALLRMTFHSNGRFDAAGFTARFRFISTAADVSVAPAGASAATRLRLALAARATCLLALAATRRPG